MPVPQRLERTLLFVPGNNRRMIEKAARAAADAVCLDLEDAVPAEDKAAARAVTAAALRELDFGRRLRLFRINGLDTPWAYRDLVEVVESAGSRLDLVMLPKTSGPGDVEFVDRLLTQIEAAHGLGRDGGGIGIEAQIENARGFVYAREIAAASPRLEALIFGPGDFAAAMQMPSSGIGDFDEYDALYPGHRWHAPMAAIVAAARAHGLYRMLLQYPVADINHMHILLDDDVSREVAIVEPVTNSLLRRGGTGGEFSHLNLRAVIVHQAGDDLP